MHETKDIQYNRVIQAINGALKQEKSQFIISPFEFENSYKNQLLFFFKPECFFQGKDAVPVDLLEMVFKKFLRFEVAISGVLLLDGKRLEELSIMNRHYGFIDTLSRNASKMLSGEETDRVKEILGIGNISDYQVLGGHEFLEQYPDFDAKSLDEFWLQKKSFKLRSGFYLQEYVLEGKKLILFNGFHPSQIRYYTDPMHEIIVLLLHSNTSWKILKQDLAGDTYPDRAKADSIRGEIFKNRQEYGFPGVSISRNFIHLSAGPFEALYEMNNFLKEINGIPFDLRQSNIYRLMKQIREGRKVDEDIDRCLANPTAKINGVDTGLFLFTEEKDTTEAIFDYFEFFSRPGS